MNLHFWIYHIPRADPKSAATEKFFNKLHLLQVFAGNFLLIDIDYSFDDIFGSAHLVLIGVVVELDAFRELVR